MTRLSTPLRLLWCGFGMLLLMLIGVLVGPTLETALAPIRANQRVEDVARDGRFLRFALIFEKVRLSPSPGVDVTLTVPGDSFDLALDNDVSRPGEPPCTHRIPWSHGQAVGVGPHRQHYCVELPETVGPDLPVAVAIVARYRGLAGLWDLRVPFPPIDSPAAASGDAHG